MTSQTTGCDLISRKGSHAATVTLASDASVKPLPKIKKPTTRRDAYRWSQFQQRQPLAVDHNYRELMKFAPGSDFSMPGYAAVVYSYKWEELQESRAGIYEIPTSGTPTTLFPVAIGDNYAGTSGAVYADGKYFVAVATTYLGQTADMTFNVYNTETWQLEQSVQGDIDFFALDMTQDPTSGKVYGWFVNSEEQYYYFGSFDINTFKVTEIKNYNVDLAIYGIAATADGALYGMSNEGYLYSIDKLTGNATMVGSNGLFTDYMTSAAIDTKTGKMYYATSTNIDAELYEIDLSNGYANRVYRFPGDEEITGFYIPAPDVEGGAPAVARNIAADFRDGSLDGSVTFTAPTLNYNNIPGSGNITYLVTLNGVEAATGTTTYGATVTVPVTAPASGQYTVGVLFTNSVGQSPVATTHVYIGHDTPTDVKNVVLSYDNGAFTLTWDAPHATNDGFINSDNIVYTIVRYPDNVTVTDSHRGTTFTEAIAEPEQQTKYFYTVMATYEGVSSEPVASNVYALGSIVPPYRCDFNDGNELNEYTVIDNNNDGKSWEWVNGEIKITYNSIQKADDYLVLPPMKLKKGMTYALSFDVKAQWADAPERVAVYVGTVPTADGLSTELLAPTTVSWDQYRTQDVYFVPENDDTYFFAIKGCSEADRFYLCVDNVSVSAPLQASSPAAPTELTVTAGNNGALTADITFTAPQVTISGTPLESIDYIEISREGNVIATLNTAPGEIGHYVDNTPVNGYNNYAVTAINRAGRGAEAMASVYIGVYEPMSVQTLTVMHGANYGQVYLGWDHVEKDVRGNNLNGSQLTYDILRRVNGATSVVAENISGTSFIDQAVGENDPQAFAYYAILPRTAGGEGDMTLSELIPVGLPYTVPFNETFAGYTMSHIFGIEQPDENYGDWAVANDVSIDGFTSQDNDNGYLVFTGTYPGATATILSGLISIGTAPNPELTFYYLTYGTNNTFDVQINAGQGFRTVKTVNLAGEDRGWVKCTVSLSAYFGRDIQFALVGNIVDRIYIAIDNLRVGSRMEHNLFAESISAPTRAKAGDPVNVNVALKNDGAQTAESYAVELYRNGNLIETKHPEAIAPDGRLVVVFTDHTNPAYDAHLDYQAKVVYDLDEYDGDNITDITSVGLEYTNYPVPTELAAAVTDNGVALSWGEPDLNAPMLNIITDGAEDYKTFSTGLPNSQLAGDNVGDWTMIDVDGLTTYVISVGNEALQFPNAGYAKSFQVFARGDVSLNNPAWDAHSGDKMFICMAAEPEGNKGNDDWMISPLLSGAEQTVSFYAKSVTTSYGADKIELYYSTGGKTITDFVSAGATVTTTEEWTEYTFDIPQGAKYFAFRCVSFDTFALCIDDITYSAAGGDDIDLSLIGYNVYRDGVKVNDEPVEEPQLDDNVAPGIYHYTVTAVYAAGESRASTPVTVDMLGGVGDIAADGVSVSVNAHTIVITGAADRHVAVHTADGKTIYRAVATDETVINVIPGIYVVSIDRYVTKVAIR